MTHLEQLPHPQYLPYPSHYTVGFFESPGEAEKAISELESLGFSDEDFNVFEGESGLQAIDLDGSHHNLVERYLRKFIKFSDSAEWRFLNEADYEIRKGHIMLCILTPHDKEKNQVHEVFKKNKAYDIRYFTPLYIEEME